MKRPFIIFLFILLAIAAGYHLGGYRHRAPVVQTFSGPVKDGDNAFGVHGMYGRTIDFSPDSQNLAYIWSHSSYMRTQDSDGRSLPLTLTESLEIRVRSTGADRGELKVPLDEVDFRPKGAIYFALDASLQMAPDSRHLAALCARRLVLVDLDTKTNSRVEYAGEFFGTFSWLDRETLIFSTWGRKAGTIFWQWKLGAAPGNRVKVYEEPASQPDVETITARIPELLHNQWSPNGRFVCLRIPLGTNDPMEAILDVQTGAVQHFPFSLYYQSWKSDSSELLVDDKFGKDHRKFLVDPMIGKIDDLSVDFEKAFGRDRDMTLVAPVWTPDGKYVVLYVNSAESTALQTGCLIQPKPFKVAYSTDQIIRWSPWPGWVLLQGSMSFKWINYDGSATAHIQGWPNDWTWSANGHYAAQIHGGKIEILKPQLPPSQK